MDLPPMICQKALLSSNCISGCSQPTTFNSNNKINIKWPESVEIMALFYYCCPIFRHCLMHIWQYTTIEFVWSFNMIFINTPNLICELFTEIWKLDIFMPKLGSWTFCVFWNSPQFLKTYFLCLCICIKNIRERNYKLHTPNERWHWLYLDMIYKLTTVLDLTNLPECFWKPVIFTAYFCHTRLQGW